jgi:peptidoglycan hydrolase-like protein with peptidoglycan-binding domain
MKTTISIAALLLAAVSIAAEADELIKMVEQDLARLGYAPGPVDGEETIDTTVAITKFQAANGMEITGEVTPELARALMAAQPADTGAPTAVAVAPAAAAAPASPPAPDPAALDAARQACLQERIAAAQESQKKKRGLGRLMSAVTRTAMQGGNYDLARTTSDVYNASATADDLAAAAKDLGLTEDDIAACENPL